MRLLLDAIVLLCWLEDPGLLERQARESIQEGSNQAFVSTATVWELAIKRSIGKLSCPEDLIGAIQECRFQPLAIRMEHAVAAVVLPAHHRDPFDRMLAA